MSNGVQCDKCGFLFEGHSNVFGKVCTRCGNYISPMNNPIEDNYDEQKSEAQNKIRQYLKKYWEEKNAN